MSIARRTTFLSYDTETAENLGASHSCVWLLFLSAVFFSGYEMCVLVYTYWTEKEDEAQPVVPAVPRNMTSRKTTESSLRNRTLLLTFSSNLPRRVLTERTDRRP